MLDYGIVMERVERAVFHVESGLVLPSSMEAIIFRRPRPVLVIVRRTYTHNATVAIGSYTVISGATLEDWKKSLEESDLMLWRPLPPPGSGLDLS